MRTLLLGLSVAALLAGCAETPKPIPVVFHPPAPPPKPLGFGAYEDGKWALAKGNNTISGHAEIAGTDGNSRNCSGASATLLPAIAATRSRMDVLYGPGRDFIQIGTARPPAGSPELERLARHASCDREGNFRFSNVPDGSFFVTAGFAGRPVASVKRQVDVRGGQNESVLLTDR